MDIRIDPYPAPYSSRGQMVMAGVHTAGCRVWVSSGTDQDGEPDTVEEQGVCIIMATTAQVQAFISQIAPLAIAEYRKGKKILPSVCIAQACCESAYGTSTKMVRANAVFGIKVGKSKYHFGTAWKDKAYSTKTKECYDGKTYTNITDMFRAYDSIADSVTDYYDLLCHCSRYRAAVGAGITDQPLRRSKMAGTQRIQSMLIPFAVLSADII